MARKCKTCGGSGRLWFQIRDVPLLELPPGCAVLLDNAAVMPAADFINPDHPLDAADMLTAKVIAFELNCPDCGGDGFL